MSGHQQALLSLIANVTQQMQICSRPCSNIGPAPGSKQSRSAGFKARFIVKIEERIELDSKSRRRITLKRRERRAPTLRRIVLSPA